MTRDPVLQYRADIDGLRAVAILSVVAYHAFPTRVQGGFAGVDIFFVISGYLISGIILRGLESGTFIEPLFRMPQRSVPSARAVGEEKS